MSEAATRFTHAFSFLPREGGYAVLEFSLPTAIEHVGVEEWNVCAESLHEVGMIHIASKTSDGLMRSISKGVPFAFRG